MKKRKIKVGKRYVLPAPYERYSAKLCKNGRLRIYGPRGELQPSLTRDGKYHSLSLYGRQAGENIRLDLREHHVVFAISTRGWEFYRKIQSGRYEIDHKDRNSFNNAPTNLRLVRHITQVRNRDVAVVTDIDVLKAMKKMRKSGATYREIGEEFNCHLSTAQLALTGKTNKDLVAEAGGTRGIKRIKKRLTRETYDAIFSLALKRQSQTQISEQLSLSRAQVQGCLSGEYYTDWYSEVPKSVKTKISAIKVGNVNAGRHFHRSPV